MQVEGDDEQLVRSIAISTARDANSTESPPSPAGLASQQSGRATVSKQSKSRNRKVERAADNSDEALQLLFKRFIRDNIKSKKE